MDDIYKELKDAVTNFVSQQSDASLKFDIRITVENFFEEVISRYTPEELSNFAGTPEKIIRHFKEYLEGQKTM